MIDPASDVAFVTMGVAVVLWILIVARLSS